MDDGSAPRAKRSRRDGERLPTARNVPSGDGKRSLATIVSPPRAGRASVSRGKPICDRREALRDDGEPFRVDAKVFLDGAKSLRDGAKSFPNARGRPSRTSSLLPEERRLLES
jgi:hypothetical protein